MGEITNLEAMIAAEHFHDKDELAAVLKRVENGELLAYIIGEWFFYRHYFKINRDCLIPRPDTECLVEVALSKFKSGEPFADLCTGSGCIGLTLLDERPDCPLGLLVDIQEGALDAARENAAALSLTGRARLVNADLLYDDPLGNERFGLIISNPPYIPTDDIAAYPSLSAEPHIALDGGGDGLCFYRRFLSTFAKNLKDGGGFVFEIGFDQGDAIRTLAGEHGFSAEITKDLSGNDRVAYLSKHKNHYI